MTQRCCRLVMSKRSLGITDLINLSLGNPIYCKNGNFGFNKVDFAEILSVLSQVSSI